MTDAKNIFSYRKYWAARFGTAPFLPMSKAEMDELGWDSCDIILVTGDAYIDHPSFGMAIIGRLLESQGFLVGIIAQPDWNSAEAFKSLGRPNLFFGVTAGNMDSMVNHYTSDRRLRRDDSYTPGGVPGKRPDRAVIVYSQRCREAFREVPIVIGGIEASLRRIAQFDHWSEKVRRSVLVDSKADLLIYGNAERALVEVAHRVAKGQSPREMHDVRGVSFILDAVPEGWTVLTPDLVDEKAEVEETDVEPDEAAVLADAAERAKGKGPVVVRLPAYDRVSIDKVLYAHASRILHQESNPGNARPLVQRHGDRQVWLTAPPTIAFQIEPPAEAATAGADV